MFARPRAGDIKQPTLGFVDVVELRFIGGVSDALIERKDSLVASHHDDGTKFRGRKPTFNWETFGLVQQLLGQGIGVAEVAKITDLKRQTIYRIQTDPGRQAAALAAWSPRPNELVAA